MEKDCINRSARTTLAVVYNSVCRTSCEQHANTHTHTHIYKYTHTLAHTRSHSVAHCRIATVTRAGRTTYVRRRCLRGRNKTLCGARVCVRARVGARGCACRPCAMCRRLRNDVTPLLIYYVVARDPS